MKLRLTSNTRAFTWSGGVMAELSPFNLYGPGNTGTTTNYHGVAMDINNAGLIVGNSKRISGSPAVATLWQSGVPIDLNTLLPSGSGWNPLSGEAINDAGDIVGYSTIGGQTRAFLMTVPEPSSLMVASWASRCCGVAFADEELVRDQGTLPALVGG